jgi:tetratricopeptide (TPR) repeat protein
LTGCLPAVIESISPRRASKPVQTALRGAAKMTRFRLGLALTILTGFVQAAPVYIPQAEVMERLAPVFATRDPVRIAMAYRAMGEYGRPAADIVESSINAMGYEHLQNGEIEEAISVFELNTYTFPASANSWDSLAEAVLANGEQETAIRFYQRSLELDPENSNAIDKIEQILGEQQTGQVSAD